MRPTRRAIWAVALAAGLLTGCGGEEDAEGGLRPFPPPSPMRERAVGPADFAGAEACAACHAEEYRAWSGSTHGRAGGEPSPSVVIAPFDGRPISYADGSVVPRVRDGAYEFVVRQDHFPEEVVTVTGVIGGGHMLGGGTQGFLTRLPDGTERFLPWDWSRGAERWFCNTGSRLERGWLPITEELRMADCGDWPPLRPIGTMDRFANCQECHGSQILTVLDTAASAYRTEYTTLQVNCESCHGPAARHVTLAERGFPDGEVALESLTWMEKDASLELCFRCHALKDVVREGYLPGEELAAWYAVKFPVLGDQPYLADGRVRSFAYQANHLASACYLEGPMDCVSCHEPHGQGYWDINREPLASPFDDGQCTACHASKAEDPEAHSFHSAGPRGVRCVDCHMPYLQHPEVGPAVPFARSDHTIALPRPVFDADLGIVTGCAACHEDRSALQLQGEARRFWGELKPHRPLVRGQVDELRARNAEEAAGMLLRPEEHDPLLQFQALSRFVVGYLQPDAADLSDAVLERLTALAASGDREVRSLALAGLHWTAGGRPDVRERLVEALRSGAEPELVRARWILALGFLGDRHRERGEAGPSETAYRKALELSPGDPRVLTNLGLLLNQTGRAAEAAAAFQESLAADPGRPLVWADLGSALASSGDPGGARAAYEEAIRLNPHEAVAHFNLGNLHQRAERLAEAVAAYRAAVEADPGLGRGHFELARVLIRLGRYEEALPHARRAVEFMPDHAPSRQMLADLESLR